MKQVHKGIQRQLSLYKDEKRGATFVAVQSPRGTCHVSLPFLFPSSLEIFCDSVKKWPFHSRFLFPHCWYARLVRFSHGCYSRVRPVSFEVSKRWSELKLFFFFTLWMVVAVVTCTLFSIGNELELKPWSNITSMSSLFFRFELKQYYIIRLI